jgi:hypothetical protein
LHRRWGGKGFRFPFYIKEQISFYIKNNIELLPTQFAGRCRQCLLSVSNRMEDLTRKDVFAFNKAELRMENV